MNGQISPVALDDLRRRSEALELQDSWTRESLALHQSLLNADPNDSSAYRRLGTCLLSLGRPEEAFSVFTEGHRHTADIAELRRLGRLMQEASQTIHSISPPPAPAARREIQEFVAQRGIHRVLHFTQVDNLLGETGILAQGLVPRALLDERRWPRRCNDDRRLDWAREASCLSISWPNYATFAAFRRRRRNVQWAILTWDERVLWECDCAFCTENAASGRVTRHPVDERKRPRALQQLFGDLEGCPLREQLRIPTDYPTHPQAEVLAFDVIAPDYLTGVLVSARDQLERLRDASPIRPTIDLKYLLPRMDDAHWPWLTEPLPREVATNG